MIIVDLLLPWRLFQYCLDVDGECQYTPDIRDTLPVNCGYNRHSAHGRDMTPGTVSVGYTYGLPGTNL